MESRTKGALVVEKLKPSAAAIILNISGTVLAIRRNKPGSLGYGIPGGKVEDGESYAEAMIREVREETGLRVKSFSSLYRGVVDDQEFFCETFLVTSYEGSPSTKSEGEVEWTTFDRLILESPFSHYNQRLLTAILSRFILTQG